VEFEPPLELDGDVVYSCLKGAEDGTGLIVRVFNPSSHAAAARVIGPVTVDRVRLDETGNTSIPSRVVRVAPGEIATLRLRPTCGEGAAGGR
jgi:alpha-mannosidase